MNKQKIKFNKTAWPYKNSLIQNFVAFAIILFIGKYVLLAQTIILNIIDRLMVPNIVYQVLDFGSIIILCIIGAITVRYGLAIVWEYSVGLLSGAIVYIIDLIKNMMPKQKDHNIEPVSQSNDPFASQQVKKQDTHDRPKTMDDVFGK